MPNYNEAQGVADLLSKFDFNIISEGPGDFSTQHRKYTCEFSKPGIESFTTTYQSNPRFGGHPTATDVFAALASRCRVPPQRSWPRDATPAHRHEKTTPSCRYIEDNYGRKVGKHHGIRQEHPRRSATAAPRPR